MSWFQSGNKNLRDNKIYNIQSEGEDDDEGKRDVVYSTIPKMEKRTKNVMSAQQIREFEIQEQQLRDRVMEEYEMELRQQKLKLEEKEEKEYKRMYERRKEAKQHVIDTINELRLNPTLFIQSIIDDYFNVMISDAEYSEGFNEQEIDELKNMFNAMKVYCR
jgi:hypothetical protein